jgi:hypothetical protein
MKLVLHSSQNQTKTHPKCRTREDSKMETRGRKQNACFLKQNLGEMLELHLAGKITKKRQNFDSSTPSAHV